MGRPEGFRGWSDAGPVLSVLVVAGVLAGFLAACSTRPLPLRQSGGTRSVVETRTVGAKNTARSVEHHVWDVRERVESTFVVEKLFGDGELTALKGEFDVEVPAGCQDRIVRWEIRADGERIGHGRLRWLRDYDLPVHLPVHGTPREVTVAAWWNGGTSSCPSFALGWDDPGMERGADFNFLDRDFYPD